MSLSTEQAEVVRASVKTLEAALQPATEQEIRALVARFVASMQVQNTDRSVLAIQAEDFIEGLEDMPAGIIAESCKQWRESSAFFPHISEFLKVAGELKHGLERDHGRLQSMLRAAENPPPDGVATDRWYHDMIRGLRVY